ncbi:hypothetical protein HNQ59_003736 [Chitinivorax tropicus]|uniref:DUF2993 domain-containing protein n=1 Tax=Chitinivorax tropicus TaxID=714531 RepID=A0A840MT77_9PROT|nr:hypothetical protein [Chitinivorax tropicus]MBB5020417.1 hypothetical protein [Chitinivorax tropicus]
MNLTKHGLWACLLWGMVSPAWAADAACGKALNLAPVAVKLLGGGQIQTEVGAVPLLGLLRQLQQALPQGAQLQQLQVDDRQIQLTIHLTDRALTEPVLTELATPWGLKPAPGVANEQSLVLHTSLVALAKTFDCGVAVGRGVTLRGFSDFADALYRRVLRYDLSIHHYQAKAVIKAASMRVPSFYPAQFRVVGGWDELLKWLGDEIKQPYTSVAHGLQLRRLTDGQYELGFEFRLVGEPVVALVPKV